MKELYEAFANWCANTPLDDFVIIILLLCVEIVGLFWLFRILFARKP